MATLDLYKERESSTVTLVDPTTKQPRDFKIPHEYTVEELERILEKQTQIEELAKQEVKGQGEAQLQKFWQLVFAELEILFQHYHPEITSVELRQMITHEEALKIIDFRKQLQKIKSNDEEVGKKKVRNNT